MIISVNGKYGSEGIYGVRFRKANGSVIQEVVGTGEQAQARLKELEIERQIENSKKIADRASYKDRWRGFSK